MQTKKKKLDMDSMAIMPEGDLHNMRNKLSSQHNSLSEKSDEGKLREIEVELCYLDREIEIRKNRKELHAKWMKENPIEYFEDEAKEQEEEFEEESDEDFYG